MSALPIVGSSAGSSLPDFVRVESAELADGLLTLELRREIPEAMKPQTIEIGAPRRELKAVDDNRDAA
jgi:molecular chaperone IbpA